MWPFGARNAGSGDRSARAARRVDVRVRVLASRLVTSPLGGEAGAFVHLEILEGTCSIASAIFGDLVTLEVAVEGAPRLDLVVRRATLHFASLRPEPLPLRTIPAEIAPLLKARSGRAGTAGELAYRAHVVADGAPLRLRAWVDEDGPGRFVLDGNAGPIDLDEVPILSPAPVAP